MQSLKTIIQSTAMTHFRARPNIILGTTILVAGLVLLTAEGLKVLYK